MSGKYFSLDNITFYLAICAMIVVPINVVFITPILILWFVIWIFENRKNIAIIFAAERSSIVLLILSLSFYVWQIVGVLYSTNSEAGWNNVVKRTSLALFPIILLFPGKVIKQNIMLLLRIFCFSTFVYIIFCFGFATYNSVGFQDGALTFNYHIPTQNWFSYYFGSAFSYGQHPSYTSMYVLFSTLIGLESFYDTKNRKSFRFFWLLISLILFVSLYFLSSRAAFLASIILLPIYFLNKHFSLKRYRFAYLFIIAGSMLLVFVSLKNQRVKILTKNISNHSNSKPAIIDSRFIIWKAALKIYERNIIFGVGTGDVQDELVKEYLKINNKELIEKKLNVHNQFIEFMLENGLIGFVLFISLLVTMFYIAISKWNPLYLIYLFIIVIFFFFESMLYRLAGIAFFAIFSFLPLHLNSLNLKNSENDLGKSDPS
jgi:O-antigen ligase